MKYTNFSNEISATQEYVTSAEADSVEAGNCATPIEIVSGSYSSARCLDSAALHALYCSCEQILGSESIERDIKIKASGLLADVEKVVNKTSHLNRMLSEASDVSTWQAIPSRTIPQLKENFKFEDHGHVDIDKDTATYYINFFINEETLNVTRFFIRWGCYDDVAENWEDLAVRHHEIIKIKPGHFYIKKAFPMLRRGWYGATCYAKDLRTNEQIWQGTGFAHDAKFRIDRDSEKLCQYMMQARGEYLAQVRDSLLSKIQNYEHFASGIEEYSKGDNGKYLSQVLFEATVQDENSRRIMSEYFKVAEEKQNDSKADGKEQLQAKLVAQVLNNLGVGEVVLVSPEGPQATFGGIAQVINGWLKAFSEKGVPVTLVSVLYEQSQGNKHTDAQSTLRNGINLCGENVRVKYCGEVDIPFGPTYRTGTQQWAQGSHNVRANVYMAEKGNVRVFLLRHNRYADKLYPRVLCDEHMRRVLFLGRGALEIMKNHAFGIRPQLIVSNDWISALVPVLQKLDMRYSQADNLKNCRTIHILHNAGKDYQGRFANHHNNQNLYPMMELDTAHWDGLMDPHQKNMFNMTAAALYHLNGGIIAVSRPYARQLLTREGADGLDSIIWKHKDGLFGISNGLDQVKLRRSVLRIGEGARSDLGLGRTREMGNEELDGFFDNLLGYKEAAKLRLQRNFGLHQGNDKIIISLIGRLAEQKGIALLMDRAAGDNCSVMELILRKYPEVQFVIAGPRVEGDDLSGRFCAMVHHLSRCFHGRVLGMYDFVPHDFAMEIFTASDFALMPSRFEPGGLTQLEALIAGALVIARNVGGISATLERFDNETSRGNGFLFDEYSGTALRNTICYTIDRTRNLDFRKKLMYEAAHAEHDWLHRAPQYISVFQHILGVLAGGSYQHLQRHADIIANDVCV